VSPRIVVADDDPDLLRLVSFTLQRRGHTVFEASAGDAALDLIRRELPNLAVLDVAMPEMTGLEVAQALSKDAQTSKIPIIMLSARGQATDVEAGRQSGATLYMVKPFVPQELALQVTQILSMGDPS